MATTSWTDPSLTSGVSDIRKVHVEELRTAVSALEAGGHISILTGTVAHGGTIPIPDGYSEAQCKWFVSAYDGAYYDSSGRGGREIWGEIDCYANASRVVTAYTPGGGERPNYRTFSANYMIIGIK
jgi:hypothetical protein